jgi:hypothetical protein
LDTLTLATNFQEVIHMETQHHIDLTATEMANLWSVYMAESMSVCINKYFLEKVEDTEVRETLLLSQKLAKSFFEKAKGILEEEKMPIPFGFTDEDVNPSAPRLFSDTFFLRYVKHESQIGIATYGLALSLSTREDIRTYLNECLSQLQELYNKVVNVMLSKGVYVRGPIIAIPQKAEYVQKQTFLKGFFGETRPLTAIEIAHIARNIESNSIGQRWNMGLSQVAHSKEVRQHMLRGKEIAAKHVEVLSEMLKKDDIPVPSTWDSVVTESTVPPFSDKLMMFQVSMLSSGGIGNYGVGLGASNRRDIGVIYTRLIAEVTQYAEDGLNIMIDNSWYEQPPQAVDRKAIIHV